MDRLSFLEHLWHEIPTTRSKCDGYYLPVIPDWGRQVNVEVNMGHGWSCLSLKTQPETLVITPEAAKNSPEALRNSINQVEVKETLFTPTQWSTLHPPSYPDTPNPFLSSAPTRWKQAYLPNSTEIKEFCLVSLTLLNTLWHKPWHSFGHCEMNLIRVNFSKLYFSVSVDSLNICVSWDLWNLLWVICVNYGCLVIVG